MGDSQQFPHTVLQVRNLNWYTTDQKLEDLFISYGRGDSPLDGSDGKPNFVVRYLRMFENQTNGKSMGVAIVEFSCPEFCFNAFHTMNGMEVDESQISLQPDGTEPVSQLSRMEMGLNEGDIIGRVLRRRGGGGGGGHQGGHQGGGGFHGHQGGGGRRQFYGNQQQHHQHQHQQHQHQQQGGFGGNQNY